MARYDNVTIIASSNTTQVSSNTIQLLNLTIQGGGNISVGVSEGKLLISGPGYESRYINEPSITQVGTVAGNSLVSIVPVQIPYELAMSNVRFGASVAPQTTTNNSTNMVVVTASLVLYSLNGSSLSSLNSGSNTFSASWTSNATGSVGGIRAFTVDWASTTMVERGNYWIAVHISSATSAFNTSGTSNLTVAQSMLVGVSAGTAAMGLDPWGVATAASRGASMGLGIISTGATRGSIDMTAITQTGTRAMVAKLWLDMRNFSLW